ncbi:molybdate ABC transporter permease subunit [Myxococcota bacterium]|nr:molybdate ABC transporter permease subunit [Myxococcota bacterium]
MIHSMLLSFKVALIATVLVILVGTLMGYLLATKHFPGKEILDVLLTLPLVMPPTVTGYYLIVLFGRRGILGGPLFDLTGYTLMFTWHGAVLASFIVSLPLMIRTSRVAIESVDENLVHTATLMGYSRWAIFLRVLLPLSRRGLIAGAILAFARALGEFGATLMVAGNIPGATDTMPISIYSHVASGEWKAANTMVMVFTAFSALFLYAALRITRRHK